jgi:AcrR family transcriptional regulator
MTDKQLETEEQIFEAACRVFQRKGYAGARMQEIADEADINKSMLHYYYRSKDKLFQKVFQQEMTRFFPIIFGVMESEDPLDEKITQLIEAYYSFLQDNPHMVQFVIMEMNQNPDRFKSFIKEKGFRPPQSFLQQIQTEVENGTIEPVEPRQLVISILGLILFPFIARTMVQTVFDMDEKAYLDFLRERKGFLVDFILNAIKYEK